MPISKIFPVSCNTKHIGPGSTFVAISGYKEDGATYIKAALSQGATKIVIEKSKKDALSNYALENPNIEFLYVDNTRKALAELAASSLGNPASKLKIIGITGTKGKTTTSFLVEQILRTAGYKTALLGSIKNKIADKEASSSLTTPESDYLHMFFAECVKQGVQYVVMEVSSHALSLHRIHGITLSAAGFTNLDAEHMDFYKDLNDYFTTKMLIFDHLQDTSSIVINRDNQWGAKALDILLSRATNKQQQIISFTSKQELNQLSGTLHQNHLEATFTLIKNSLDGLKLSLSIPKHKTYNLSIPSMFGEFNAYNSVMAYLLCMSQGVSHVVIQEALEQFSGVPGRLQLHRLKNGALAFVDYAHNPSSFHGVLNALRAISPKLIVVFGCGGDRDTTKRPVMGNLAATYGDTIIITDDNPRFEDRHAIIQGILQGIHVEKQAHVICQPDRQKAIATAAALADHQTVIAILGKGHEQYCSIKGENFYFDDLEEIKQF